MAGKKNITCSAVAFALVCFIIAASVLPCFAEGTSVGSVSGSQSTALGVMTVCSYDAATGVIRIAGTVNHKVMTAAKDCRIALFRIPSWRSAESVIADSQPISETAMSIRFEFTFESGGAEDIICMYAAAIVYPDGSRALIAEPEYPLGDVKEAADIGFKGLGTDSAAGVADAGAGCVMIDVYLDRLEDGRHSGYLQTVGGMSFYYNREYVDDLDRRIRSASVAGSSVWLRLLVSPTDTPDGLSYASSASYGAAYRGVVISDDVSALTVYAYLLFLCTRYNGGTNGSVNGIVPGFCADEPEKYNFCASTGPMYYEIYARTLAIMGIAASGAGARLIVPVSDSCGVDGQPLFTDFVRGVADYISKHTGFGFTLMLDSTHNAYHIDDSYFDLPNDGGDDTADEGEEPDDPDHSYDPDLPDDEFTPPETERKEPVKTLPSDGYICTDSIAALPAAIDTLHGEYSAVSREFIWCWTPGAETSGSALSVLYAYNYVALAAAGASGYILRTDSDRFSTVSHLVKYIDTDSFEKETAYALEIFGAASWKELFPGFDAAAIGGRRIVTVTPGSGVPGHSGTYRLWDFGTSSGVHGWSAGPGCTSLRSVYGSGTSCLKAVLTDEGGGAYSDICRVCESPEPLKYTPYMGFELSCAGDASDDSLYEVKLVIYSGGVTLEGRTVVKSGARTQLYLDVSSLSSGAGINAVRVAARRISGKGEFDLRIYDISLYSDRYGDRELAGLIDAERANAAESRDGSGDGEETSGEKLTAALMLGGIAAIGVCIAVLPARRDKRRTAT